MGEKTVILEEREAGSFYYYAKFYRRYAGLLHARTARKIEFTLNLISIKVEVKYDYSFDLDFDTRLMCVKNVMAFPIHLIRDKEEGKCSLNFDPTFDACQRRNQIFYVFAMHLIPVKGEVKHLNSFDSSFDALQRRSKTPRLCTTLIITLCHVKGEVKYGHIVRLLFKRPNYLCFRIFSVLTIK